MRRLLPLLLLLPLTLPAQKPIPSPDWCALKKQAATPPPFAQDSRSDSIDILHTTVTVNLLNAPQVTARCTLQFSPKVNGVPGINLDLQGLTVDSVRLGGSVATFTKTSNLLSIPFPTLPAAGDTLTVEIVYHGVPAGDASGWGGFYNTGGYTFNLGVGFAADPHSFGRAWVPCFDNFVERSTYEVTIVSAPNRPGYSNGLLVNESQQANQVSRTWRLEQPIPSYLACFAAGPYVSWKRNIDGIPVDIACAAADSNKVKTTFQHLPQALQCFDHWFGPYLWPKVGYSLVPFNSGAMEHATNVAIGRSFIDGSLGYETLWAHELSHHWWGDLATCSTAEDMWLNEGWAVYSEHLFTEWTYGRQKYLDAVSSNFLSVLENTHVAEGGYRAVSGVPHDLTYGQHVYNKGPVVAHNLRGYLGDSLFRTGVRAALAGTRFDDWSSADLRDKLTAATGKDLTDFFNDWVFSPGFPHFSVDSAMAMPGPDSAYFYKVFVKQKLRGAPHFYRNVPLEFTFVNDQWQRITRTATVSDENSEVLLDVPAQFNPKFVWVNTRLNLTLARADKEMVVKTTGSKSFNPAKMTVVVNTLPDSALIRVEHHYVMPDTAGLANPNGYRMTHRYWTVDGDFPPGFDATANLFYDGKGQLDQLDTELFAQTSPSEDSVILLYRPAPGVPWTEYPNYVLSKLTSSTDKYGLLRLNNLQTGQYTVAKGVSTLGVKETETEIPFVSAHPNPADSVVRLKSEEPFDKVLMFSEKGENLREWSVTSTDFLEVNVSRYPAGRYWFVLYTEKGAASCPVVLVR